MEIEYRELNRKEMGARIKARRKLLGISTKELAEMLSVSAKFVADVENGNKGLSLKNMYKLKQILSVSMDFLMEGDDAEVPDDEKRRLLNENIIGSLSVCSVKQLGCMEQMARIYAESIVDKDR